MTTNTLNKKKMFLLSPGVVVHAYNLHSNYSGNGDRQTAVQGQPRKVSVGTYLKTN
jgi:hypothetical protein